MFNLLKSDIYRLVHGKMFWVAAIVLVALSVLAAGMMHWVSSPEFLRMTATGFEMTVNVSDGVTGGAGVLGEGDAGAANASVKAAGCGRRLGARPCRWMSWTLRRCRGRRVGRIRRGQHARR